VSCSFVEGIKNYAVQRTKKRLLNKPVINHIIESVYTNKELRLFYLLNFKRNYNLHEERTISILVVPDCWVGRLLCFHSAILSSYGSNLQSGIWCFQKALYLTEDMATC